MICRTTGAAFAELAARAQASVMDDATCKKCDQAAAAAAAAAHDKTRLCQDTSFSSCIPSVAPLSTASFFGTRPYSFWGVISFLQLGPWPLVLFFDTVLLLYF